MFYKIVSSKATPYDAIYYVCRKDKVIKDADGKPYMATYNMLCVGEDSVNDKYREFLDLASNNENMGYDFRKYYHAKLSPAEKDVPPEKLLEIGEEFIKEAYPNCQVIMSVHNDTGRNHLHMVINAVQLDYYKVQDKEQDRFKKQQFAMEELPKRYGLQPTLLKDYLSLAYDRGEDFIDKEFLKQGKKTDRMIIKETIDNALDEVKNYDEFVKYLQEHKIEIENCKETIFIINEKGEQLRDENGKFITKQVSQIKYRYNNNKKAFRPRKLGYTYSMQYIKFQLGECDKQYEVEEIKNFYNAKNDNREQKEMIDLIREKYNNKFLERQQQREFERQLNEIIKESNLGHGNILERLIALLQVIIEAIKIAMENNKNIGRAN